MASVHKMERHGTTVVLLPTSQRHSATVIYMHGLGDTADGWSDSLADAIAPSLPHAKFILPTARSRPVTINGGLPMPAWYDIESLGRARTEERCEGIAESRARIEALIQKEVRDATHTPQKAAMVDASAS